MERLTKNKEASEMGMVELAHNCCYAKDGVARYRDFEMDMDARNFARNLMVTLTDDELPIEDDSFDEEILENLQYDPFADVRGLIALFYRNLWAMADLRERLKYYEDLEEQGLMLKLPCKVGDTVYAIEASDEEFEHFHCGLGISKCEFDFWMIPLFGKCVFLTQEEALKRMEEDSNAGRI